MMLDENTILTAARQFIHRPYQHAGRGAKVDCMGYLLLICDALGYPYKDYPHPYSFGELRGKFRDLLAPYVDVIAVDECVPGDMLSFWFDRHERVEDHIAMLGRQDAQLTLLHVYDAVGQVVETPFDERWMRRALHGYRFRGRV